METVWPKYGEKNDIKITCSKLINYMIGNGKPKLSMLFFVLNKDLRLLDEVLLDILAGNGRYGVATTRRT